MLILALPLITAWVVGRNRYRLALVRTVTPQLVAAGQPARVTLTLSNEGRTPNGVLLLEDHVPYVLGTRPRFVVEGIGMGWRETVSYQVRSDVRGHFEIGPMSVRVTDPFGLVELGRTFRTTVPLTVTPRTVLLPQIPLGGAWTGSGDNRPRAFATGSAEDVTVREYRQGDDLRRVHWRSSARLGELMVRREEQPWQSRATLFLDNRAIAHRGQGIASSLEAAVSAAASIAVHLSHRGFAVRLVTATGEDPSSSWHVRSADLNTGPLLEALAVVQPTEQTRLDTGWLTEGSHGGLTVAVFGAVAPTDLPVLRRMQHQAGSALAHRARRRRLDRRTDRRRRHPAARPAGLADRPARPARPARRGLAGARAHQRPDLPRRRPPGAPGPGMNRARGSLGRPHPARRDRRRHHLGRDDVVARLHRAARRLPEPAVAARDRGRRHRRRRPLVALAGARGHRRRRSSCPRWWRAC